MTVLGVDPGLASLGWGVIRSKGGKHTHVDHGVIETPSGWEREKRLLHIHQELCAVIERYRPIQGAVEILFFTKNITSALPVAEARGVAILAMAQKGIKVAEYTPMQIKQALVGIGRADKLQVQEMVKLLLGLAEIPRPDHAADALAAAVCHLNSTGSSLLFPRFH